MKPERWRVRSLRRFRDHEVILYIYLGIGGFLSMIYCFSAIVHTRLYEAIFNPGIWVNHAMLLKVITHVITLSVMRAVLWLPQLFWQVIMGGAPLAEWLTAANVVKELM